MKMEIGEVYEKTIKSFGVMYGPGTLVAPQYKVSAFDEATSSQGLGGPECYIEYLRIFHLQYRPQMPTSLSCVNGLSCSPQLLGLDRLLHPLAGLAGGSRSEQDEIDQYLREGVVNISPSAYWKDHQREWPVLTRLARDLLSIPATGAGAERLFTVAQNIYHTRAGSLDESTMRDLVMYAYSEGSESGKQLISRVGRDTASDEEWEEFEEEAERPEPISDDEWSSGEMSVDERSEDDGNNQAATVILESPPTDDLEQGRVDKGEDSFLSRPRQNPPTAQTRPRKPSPWAGLGLSQQARGRVVIRETQPKTQMGTRDYPKKQKKLTDHFTLSYAVIFDYLIVSMA
ncbi:unnamed protein product [Penicillium salamii]|nr:unnamed protein product [Penicillium salamii]